MTKLLPLLSLLLLAGVAQGAEPARLLPKTNVLPLALDDSFEFRKTLLFTNDARIWKSTGEQMINFERLRMNYGAVSSVDRQQRYGNYYTFNWRSKRPANLKVRFEYLQEQLGAHVQSQERAYEGAKGTFKSEFSVTGDAYLQEGRVTAWRALLIENGRIVALNQSYLWR